MNRASRRCRSTIPTWAATASYDAKSASHGRVKSRQFKIDHDRDAITDNGEELYNLFAQRGIDNVAVCGVHLNMCVLGRPVAIRQLVKQVVLVRDMTDTMYNHRMRPFVDHFAGTELVIEHVEKYWCPTIKSTDFLDGKAFRIVRQSR